MGAKRKAFDEWVTCGPAWQVLPVLLMLGAFLFVLIFVPILFFVSWGHDQQCISTCERAGSTMDMRNSYGCFCKDGQRFRETR